MASAHDLRKARNRTRVGDIDEDVNETGRVLASAGCVTKRDEDFASLYRDEYQNALRLAWLVSNGSADCDDIVQNAFIRLQHRGSEVINPAAYLRTVVINLCREAHRRRQRDEARARLVTNGEQPSMMPVDLHLLELVAALPYAQRAALVLRYWSDLPDAEIGEILGVRQATVRSLVHRGTRRLRKEMSDDE